MNPFHELRNAYCTDNKCRENKRSFKSPISSRNYKESYADYMISKQPKRYKKKCENPCYFQKMLKQFKKLY